MSDSVRVINGKEIKPREIVYSDEPIKDGSLKCIRIDEEPEELKRNQKKKEVMKDGLSEHVESKSVGDSDKEGRK